MGKWLLLIFTVVPLVETFLLYVMGQTIGFWWTIVFMIVTALLGTFFGKREGLKVWEDWKTSIAQGRMPEEGILGGVLVLLGAALLITPGVLTDATGLAMMIPPSRKFIAKHVRKHLEQRFAAGPNTIRYRVEFGDRMNMPKRGDFVDIDGEVIEERRRGDVPEKLES